MIHVAIPTYDGRMHYRLAYALLNDLPRHECRLDIIASSFLTRTFNSLWCNALNDGADYFLMVHADLYPVESGWIATMLQELRSHDADALSAVMAIKDEQGLTSTALTSRGNTNQRRITMRELKQLPETFCAADAARLFGTADDMLLLNTGLFLVDLKRHRPEIESLRFRVRDVVQKDAEGKFCNWAWSEDWHWSRDAHTMGLSLWATRKVKAIHAGGADYCNCCEWGALEHDNAQPIPEV